MHICFFNRSYWPDVGATGQLLTELADDLVADHGCEVTVVSGYPLRSENGLPHSEVRNGVAIVRAAGTTFDPHRFAGRASNYLTYFLTASIAGLGVRRPDIVVALTDPPIIGLAALAAARRSGARFVFLCQDIFPEVARLLDDFQSPAVERALDRVNRLLLRRADAVIALGDTMKRRLVDGKSADPRKISVIHNWADCGDIAPGPRDTPFSRAHGLRNRFVVMHAGNIGLSQQLEIMLEAAERLRARDDIRFVLVGDGSRRAPLAQQARDRGLSNVVFLPYQPREEMPHVYASADVFVVSLKQGLAGYVVPSKLYGILAAGRPYVAAVEDASEVAQITREHGCGFVVPPGDADALVARVLELHGDPSLARRLGERARVAGLAYDRRRQVAAYASLFHALAARGAGG